LGNVVQMSGVTANDFTHRVVLIVTAADSSITQYTVTVIVTGTSPREIYVANALNNTVSVFDASLAGDVNALRQFGSLTGLNVPQSIVVDAVNNEIFVANNDNPSITVYGRTDTGNIAPVRTISGASTGLNGPSDIAFW